MLRSISSCGIIVSVFTQRSSIRRPVKFESRIRNQLLLDTLRENGSALQPDRAAFPPEHQVARLWRTAVTLLARRLNPERRARSLPRVVKRKYTKWHVKRAAHADWPQPTHLPEITLTLVS